MTWVGGKPFEADRLVLDAAFRRVGTGGVGVGPFEVAVELGMGRRPPKGFSDMLLKGALGVPGIRSGRSIIGRGENTKVDAGTI